MNETAALAYDLIDRFLRNNLGDEDYAEYSAALETVYTAAAPTPRKPEPKQEPVYPKHVVDLSGVVYTAPTPRKPVELTDEELGKVINSHWGVSVWKMARAVIAAYEAKQQTN